MSRVIGRELYGSTVVRTMCVEGLNGHIQLVPNSQHRFKSISQFFRSVFLPQGYPDSVSHDYMEYQIWDTIQAFSSSVTGSLATRAVLQGFGVGDDTASVMAATVTWILKDGTGMLGRILFAWVQGSYLDCDCKRWRLFADVLNDVAICLEILAPLFQIYFRFIICVAGVCKSIVGVAGGATRAALTQHQARRNNMADVSAKDGSQETLVQLASLLFSLLLMHIIADSQRLVWCLFVLFTLIHLFANYRAVTAVTMETFNQSRLHIVVSNWLLGTDRRHVLSVKDANLLEPVLLPLRRHFHVNLGCSLAQLCSSDNADLLLTLFTIFKDSRYLLMVNKHKGHVDIVLHTDAEYIDQLMACYHAELINFCFTSRHKKLNNVSDVRIVEIIDSVNSGDVLSLVRLSQAFVSNSFDGLCATLELRGWNISVVQLCADEWRADWHSAFTGDMNCPTDNKKHF